jgi:hypothetical protein
VASIGDGAMQMNGIAELVSIAGIRVERAEGVGRRGTARRRGRPVLLETVVAPDAPQLRPFPAGEQKLDSFHRAGRGGRRGRTLARCWTSKPMRSRAE